MSVCHIKQQCLNSYTGTMYFNYRIVNDVTFQGLKPTPKDRKVAWFVFYEIIHVALRSLWKGFLTSFIGPVKTRAYWERKGEEESSPLLRVPLIRFIKTSQKN